MDFIYVIMEIFYQTRISYLKLVGYFGLKPKLAMRYPIKAGIWRIGKCKEATFVISKQIFKAFSEKNSYLVCPDNPTFQEHNDVQGTKVYHSHKENLTNITFWGRKKRQSHLRSIIFKSF